MAKALQRSHALHRPCRTVRYFERRGDRFSRSAARPQQREALRCLDLDLPATIMADGRGIPGRVRKLSPGFALFVRVKLSVAPGALLELRVLGIDRKLPARFVEFRDGGSTSNCRSIAST